METFIRSSESLPFLCYGVGTFYYNLFTIIFFFLHMFISLSNFLDGYVNKSKYFLLISCYLLCWKL